MKLTKNQQMLLGAAALVGVAVFLYNRNKKANATSGNGGNGEETSSFGGRRLVAGTTKIQGTKFVNPTRAAYQWCRCEDGQKCRDVAGGNCNCCSGMDYDVLK